MAANHPKTMTPSLGTLPIDLTRLLETRMLIQSNSGGGKSHALRRVLEQTASGVQQIVIDPEGEFASLRERFDYIICAPSGADAVATPATAAALARALWESGVSAVVDIYELKAHDRIAFVRRFVEALVNAPKKIWHPTLVAIDEVHLFAPQAGQAESLGAVTDLATRGRKRGLSLLAATQRLSKLHKDVAAELLNKLIGRTGLDVDVARAADELGMARIEARTILRDLEPGQFFAYGPALSRAVTRTQVGPVLTTHPQAGHRMMSAPPPPSPALMSKLSKLEGLQRAVNDEARTVEALAAEVADLRRKLSAAEKRSGAAGVSEAEVARRVREAVATVPTAPAGPVLSKAMLSGIEKISAGLQAVQAEVAGAGHAGPPQISRSSPKVQVQQRAAAAPAPAAEGVSSPQQKILDVLAQLELFGVAAPSKPMIAAHAGVSPTSGGYFNNLGKLRSTGLIEYPAGGTVSLTETGRGKANFPARAPTLRELHESWLRIISNPQAAILEVVLAIYPNAIAKDELADRVGVSRTSGGYFNNLGHLRTLGAIDYPQKGTVAATAILFPKGKP